MFGLITGSGFYDIPELSQRSHHTVETPYGSASVTTGRWGDAPVAFLPRHGADHRVPPHAINYRANIWALHDAGVSAILATAVSGSMQSTLPPGAFVTVSDYMNFTSGRADTFFDGADGTVVHTDMTMPYDPALTELVHKAAAAEAVEVQRDAIYCATNGPRFETPAEIAMMAKMGGDLVGMTGYPEVALARELDIAYAAIGIVSNAAAGYAGEPLTADDVFALVDTLTDPLYRLIGRTVALWQAQS